MRTIPRRWRCERSGRFRGTIIRYIALAGLICVGAAPAARAQGPLTPPGAPAETMKSLQQIWDAIAAMESQNSALRQQVADQQSDLDAARAEIDRMRALNSLLPEED